MAEVIKLVQGSNELNLKDGSNYETKNVYLETPFDNEIAFNHRSSCGFSFGNECSGGISKVSLFGTPTHKNTMSGKVRRVEVKSK